MDCTIARDSDGEKEHLCHEDGPRTDKRDWDRAAAAHKATLKAKASLRRIEGGQHFPDLFCAMISDFNGQSVPDDQLRDLKLIKESIGSDEKGHMVQLIKVLLQGPAPSEGDPES